MVWLPFSARLFLCRDEKDRVVAFSGPWADQKGTEEATTDDNIA